MKRHKQKLWPVRYRMLSLIFILALLASGCAQITQPAETAIEQEKQEEAQGPLQVYLMGHGNYISSEDKEWEEYSLPVTIGLETTWYMPGYAQGNPLYQALLDYADETETEIQVTFFDNSTDLMQQVQENTAQGEGPDLALIVKQFSANAQNSWWKLLQDGTFENLSPYLNHDVNRYYEPVLRSGQYQEKQYLVPLLFDLSGFVTSEEFLQEVGQAIPTEQASYEEIVNLFRETCMALQQNSSKLALYEGTTIWEHYIMNALLAAAGYGNLQESKPLAEETVQQILSMMREFLVQNWQKIPGCIENTAKENRNKGNALYDRFNFGPLYAEDPEYKREMLGIMLDGGFGGHLACSSLIMQAYALQTYYGEMGENVLVRGIPMAGSPGEYTANVTVLGFSPAGCDQVEGAAACLQYLLDYDYPPEIGISVSRERVEEDLAFLQNAATELYIQPQYDPMADKAIQQELFNQSKVIFNPMQEEVAQTLQQLLDHIGGASLPYGKVMSEGQVILEAYWDGEQSAQEAARSICSMLNQFWGVSA